MAFSSDKPAGRLFHPEGKKREATQAVRPRLGGQINEVFLVHVRRGHQYEVRQVNKLAAR
jgi:hypothetical protein